jgi:hypothetical protein
MSASNTGLCPHCEGLSIRLENLGRDAIVDYYRCSGCAYVWSRSRFEPEPVNGLTIKKKS